MSKIVIKESLDISYAKKKSVKLEMEDDIFIKSNIDHLIEQLNIFNKETAGLKSLRNAIVHSQISVESLDAFQIFASQMTKIKTANEELSLMPKIVKSMEFLYGSFPSIKLLDNVLPKSFFENMERAKEIINNPFYLELRSNQTYEASFDYSKIEFDEMIHSMNIISIPSQISKSSLAEYKEIAKNFDESIPDFSTLKYDNYFDNIESESKINSLFSDEDILNIIRASVVPLSFIDILDHLGILTELSLSSYEGIKGIIFNLLENSSLKQVVFGETKHGCFEVYK